MVRASTGRKPGRGWPDGGSEFEGTEEVEVEEGWVQGVKEGVPGGRGEGAEAGGELDPQRRGHGKGQGSWGGAGGKEKSPLSELSGLRGFLAATYSPTGLSPAVPSAQEVLTTEFGMGSGVSPPAMPPRKGGSVS